MIKVNVKKKTALERVSVQNYIETSIFVVPDIPVRFWTLPGFGLFQSVRCSFVRWKRVTQALVK